MILDPVFDFGDLVWNRAGMYDETVKVRGVITEYQVMPGPIIKYEVRWEDNSMGVHYAYELSDSPFENSENLN
jgi:hypothetical protein